MRATACFDIGYKVSDICDDEGDTAQEKCQRFLKFLPPMSEDVWRGMMYCQTHVSLKRRMVDC